MWNSAQWYRSNAQPHCVPQSHTPAIEWISKLFDIDKLPSKVLFAAAVLTGAMLFFPPGAQKVLGVDQLTTTYRGAIGATFLGASTLLIVNLAIWIWRAIAGLFRAHRMRAVRDAALTCLDRAEVAVLREFALQGRNVIELPFDHRTVTGLISKGILEFAGTHGYSGMAGMVFPVKMAVGVSERITLELLGLPRTPTSEQIEQIKSERPNYVGEIAKHDQWRGGF